MVVKDQVNKNKEDKKDLDQIRVRIEKNQMKEKEYIEPEPHQTKIKGKIVG